MRNFQYYIVFLLASILLVFLYAGGEDILGAIDSWMYLYSFTEHSMFIQSVLTGNEPYYAFFPNGPLSIYGETCYGISVFFQLFKLLGVNDAVAFNLTISTILSFNGFCFFILSERIVGRRDVSFIFGLFVIICTTSLSYVCQINMLSWFPLFLTQFLLMEWHADMRYKRVVVISLLAGLTIYFSGYIFFMNILILCLFVIWRWSGQKGKIDVRSLLSYGAAACLVIGLAVIPYALVVAKATGPEMYNPDVRHIALKVLSFHAVDLLRSLDGNLVYRFTATEHFHRVHSFNNGILLLLLAILGFAINRNRRMNIYLAVVFVVFLGISVGIFYHISYDFFINRFFRTPLRAFIVCMSIIFIYGALGLKFLLDRLDKRYHWAIILPVVLLFALENLPSRMVHFSPEPLPFEQYEVHGRDTVSLPVVLHLPSGLFVRENQNIPAFIREMKYAYYSQLEHTHTVNGSNGFFTYERMLLDTLINSGEYGDISKAVDVFDISRIAIHSEMQADRYDSAQVALFREWLADEKLTQLP